MTGFVFSMLPEEQVQLLAEPLLALGEYHTRIAENREYVYPTQPVSDTVETIAEAGMNRVDLRVVLGNPAAGFYEKYGFAPRILVMSKKL